MFEHGISYVVGDIRYHGWNKGVYTKRLLDAWRRMKVDECALYGLYPVFLAMREADGCAVKTREGGKYEWWVGLY